MEATLVFPHQLFDVHPAVAKGRPVFLVEDPLFFGSDRHWSLRLHVQKLVLHRATMEHWRQEQAMRGIEVQLIELPSKASTTHDVLRSQLKGISRIHFCDVADDVLNRRLLRLGIPFLRYETPMFLTPLPFLKQHLLGTRKPFMATFYQAQRRRLNLLLDTDRKPIGGKWSFDSENRERLPKHHTSPQLPHFDELPAVLEAKKWAHKHYPDALGSSQHFRWAVTRQQALLELDSFLCERLKLFGHYEDSISHDQPWLYHSTLSVYLNIGLLTPQEVLDRTLQHAANHEIPLNSLEGFIRQIIGWREFMRGIYTFHGVRIRNLNFWNHSKPLPESFYDGTTGIHPVDTVIRRLHDHAWCHHIERLMVLGNIMMLKEFDPHAVYRWFMELFIDAYDWVMVPNVYGMSQFADGGTFTTKPYFSGSNYLLKMSNYPKGLWCAEWDSLFWNFIGTHADYFRGNSRMSILVKQWEKRRTKT